MRTSAEVESEVEASRDHLDRNMEALKQKMSPGQLFDEAARMFGGAGQEVASRFVEQAKANPMPLAVMGLGLAWLLASDNRRPAASTGYVGEPRSFAGASDVGGADGGLRGKAHAAGERAHEMMEGLQERVGGARAAAADATRSAGESMGSIAADARERAGQVGHQARRTFMDTMESEPLLVAGLGLVVGAAIGAALPATEAENRMMGERRDHLVEKGKALAQSGVEKAGAAAQATYNAAKSELSHGDDARPPAERLADAARSGVQAARDQSPGAPH